MAVTRETRNTVFDDYDGASTLILNDDDEPDVIRVGKSPTLPTPRPRKKKRPSSSEPPAFFNEARTLALEFDSILTILSIAIYYHSLLRGATVSVETTSAGSRTRPAPSR